MRFALIILGVLVLAAPVMAAQKIAVQPYQLTDEDKKTLEKAEDYLSDLHTISSDFIQAAPNGDITSGKFYLQRPGKLRMEYSPPMPVLMVASGGDIVYYDKELDQVTHISLGSTLVGFLARDHVKFDDTVIITYFEHKNGSLRISLVQTKKPKDGNLTLEFSDRPLVLRNIIMTDNSGQITTVSLNNARFNVPLDKDLFIFKDPHKGSRSIQK
jgi:outer membrane lipoprotein-sorting protein